eukprot:TRINITY_DN348_c0_g4_i1.p1 TRINITY_DN348_c0_g4~~TRINITY_DN348_c0_g4_i1.p1  ORF type:complete len:637 (+),score=261.82 TRINITY_DN348_c0_g4_i1:195-1913(+)
MTRSSSSSSSASSSSLLSTILSSSSSSSSIPLAPSLTDSVPVAPSLDSSIPVPPPIGGDSSIPVPPPIGGDSSIPVSPPIGGDSSVPVPPPIGGDSSVPLPPTLSAPVVVVPMRVPTKPKQKPSKKMKQLHWKRIVLYTKEQESELPTMWRELKLPTLDFGEFESEFGVEEKKIVSSDSSGKGSDSKEQKGGFMTMKKVAIRVLDDKKSNAIAILMNALPKPPLTATKKALVSLDSGALSSEVLTRLTNVIPSNDDVDQIRSVAEVEGEAKLDMPEQFVLMLSTVPKLSQRITVWQFALKFDEQQTELASLLSHLLLACKALQTNEHFKQVIGLVLALGNYANATDVKKSQADGFEISYLTQLANTKNHTGTLTFLGYVAQLCKSQFPDCLTLKDEMNPVIVAASEGTLTDLKGRIHKLNSGYTSNRKMAESLYKSLAITDSNNNSNDVKDEFKTKMTTFFEAAEAKVKDLVTRLKEAEELYEKVNHYFGDGDKGKVMESSELMGVFKDFINGFHNSIPKDKKAAASGRKFDVGKKIVQGDGKMDAIIDAMKSGGGLAALKKKTGNIVLMKR